jgi:hypothetical protein
MGDKLDYIASVLEDIHTATLAVPAGVGGRVGGAMGAVGVQASFRARYPRNN